MTAYYNEIDPYAVEWLRNLIKAGHIAPGEVDSRSILDVAPDDLRGFTQCHFFAGIGVWSYALRRAGWPDDRAVWTGSCPCQPFSLAGAAGGMSDERHLWPYWFHLIEERRPVVVVGEQVEAAIKHGWLDLVCADMEGLDYAVAALGFPAASVGAPHIRQRLYWLAHTNQHGLQGRAEQTLLGAGWREERNAARCSSASLADRSIGAGTLKGFWQGADWLLCRDERWRPVEPGTFPLAHGAPARVGRLRAYGNAIDAPQATEFMRAVMECLP